MYAATTALNRLHDGLSGAKHLQPSTVLEIALGVSLGVMPFDLWQGPLQEGLAFPGSGGFVTPPCVTTALVGQLSVCLA